MEDRKGKVSMVMLFLAMSLGSKERREVLLNSIKAGFFRISVLNGSDRGYWKFVGNFGRLLGWMRRLF